MLTHDEMTRLPFTLPVGVHLGMNSQFGGYTISLQMEKFSVFPDEEQARWFSVPRGAQEIRKNYRSTNVDRLPYVRYCRKNSGIVDALSGVQFFPLWAEEDTGSVYQFPYSGETTLVRVTNAAGEMLHLSPLFLTIVNSRQEGDDFPKTVSRFAEKNNDIGYDVLSRLISEDFVTCLETRFGVLLVI